MLAVGVRANVVRTERVDLGDVRQKCRKRGTDAASGANQIPGVVRLFYQLMRNHIHHGIPVFYNTVKLLIHPRLYNGRQHLAVDAVCLFVAHIHQILLTVFDGRRIRAVFYRLNLFAQIRNPVGIGDDDLFGLFFAEIRKFLQHLLGGSKVERRLLVRVGKSLCAHQHAAVNLVLRIHKMHVTGRHGRHSQTVAQLYDFTV